MGKINVLGFDIANLIAAGEVVDRPASVVKELLENAVDSGADTVTVEIRHGGVTYIRVVDNGCGMSRDDLPTAILRHATSKISTAEDLSSIMTLGFRGEALAAIASVTRLRIISKTPDAPYGNILEANGGEIVALTETGCTDGTTVIAEDLFYNVPARRKFLKKDSTEAIAVGNVVEKIALSNPAVSIKYITDGEVKFRTSGDGKLYNTIYAVFGRDVASRSIAVDREDGGIRVSGYISEPDAVKSNRNMENFFINGRYVKSRTAAAALEQAYVSRIASEKFPFCVLNITLNPNAVDVNVHPAKLEVKFTNERLIFDAVYYAVLSALESRGTRPELTIGGYAGGTSGGGTGGAKKPDGKRGDSFWVADRDKARELINAFKPAGEKSSPARDQIKLDTRPTVEDLLAYGGRISPAAQAKIDEAKAEVRSPQADTRPASVTPKEELPYPTDVPPPADADAPPVAQGAIPETVPMDMEMPKKRIPDYVILGEAFNCYVIVQLEDRLLMIDKHAAHERIIYEDLRARTHAKEKHAQLLLFPLEIDVDEMTAQAVDEYVDEIRSLGFDFAKDVRKGKLLINQIPEELSRESAAAMMESFMNGLADGTANADAMRAEYFDKLLYRASCKAAIKGGHMNTREQIKWVCDRLLKEPEGGGTAIKTCPHGRPVAFEIKKTSIERQFERS